VNPLPVFKTGALNHSATLPCREDQWLSDSPNRNALATLLPLDPSCTRLQRPENSGKIHETRPATWVDSTESTPNRRGIQHRAVAKQDHRTPAIPLAGLTPTVAVPGKVRVKLPVGLPPAFHCDLDHVRLSQIVVLLPRGALPAKTGRHDLASQGLIGPDEAFLHWSQFE
jgi:hypothetical protein